VELIEQVGVGLHPGQVALDQLQGEPPVGDHPVPVGHQVVLGHRGQAGQVGLLEAVRVDPGEPVAVPWRGRLGHLEQVAQPVPAFLAQPVGRPAQPLDVLGQIYAETERLARLGLLAEEREQTGRRRRSYRITAEGRAALAEWLAEPTDEPPQFRSLGLLKLFFGQHARPEDVAALARAQAELHRRYVELTTGIIERLKARGDRPSQLAVAELMGEAYQVMTRQWERIEEAAAAPPAPVAAPHGR
jgi:DNA-binding PadR family transcriptional regulator